MYRLGIISQYLGLVRVLNGLFSDYTGPIEKITDQNRWSQVQNIVCGIFVVFFVFNFLYSLLQIAPPTLVALALQQDG